MGVLHHLQMQAPVWVKRIVGWRWTPTFALVAGSLAFVGVVVAIVPDDFGAVASGTSRLSRATRSRPATNVEATNNVETNAEASTQGAPATSDEDRAWLARDAQRRSGVGSDAPGNVVQSIFHSAPKVELPVEPVDPTPQPPPPSPPPPTATATTFTLQMPPGSAPPEPPSEPQGITGQ